MQQRTKRDMNQPKGKQWAEKDHKEERNKSRLREKG
jgi:hypothetical protein